MNFQPSKLVSRALPQLSGRPFLTDGGIETTLIYHDGLDLPLFAAFTLLDTAEGRDSLRRYYRRYLDIAAEAGTGFILESPTWRASRDWGLKLGYEPDAMVQANQAAIALMADLRESSGMAQPVVVSGCVGPRGDGYSPDTLLSADEAEAYHAHQVEAFADTEVDMVCAITMTHAGEAAGVARAARAVSLPVALSFTVETDGRLPSGQPLTDAIRQVDDDTGGFPAYYMINCAHPEHFEDTLRQGGDALLRIRGVRANASTLSHAELDTATSLDDGDPEALGASYVRLRNLLPNLNVMGGCCGTDHRHVRAMAQACA